MAFSQLQQTALVTGASSGIGLELARLLAANHYNLILVARSADKLGELAADLRRAHKINAVAVPIDLADPAAAEELFHVLNEQRIFVDVLVNNAGFGTHGPFAQSDPAIELQMLQVNIMALTHLTRLFLPNMIANGRGRILNVASTAAFQPGPFMAGYYASKAFVLSFSEAIAAELKGSGVTVTALCPGPTNTGFQERAGVAETPLFKANTMTSQEVARIGFEAMMKGKPLAIAGLKNRLLAFSTRLAPRGLVTSIARKLNSGR
jgi:short-subunit dehydrogenase